MKRFFRYVGLVLAVVMLLSIPTYAAETRASSYIMSTCVYLKQINNTQFRVWHEVIALGIMDELGAYEIKVQESTDGNNWYTVRTYSCYDYPSMVTTNEVGYTNYVLFTGTPGRFYRARMVMFAENETGRGEVITYTTSKKLLAYEMT